MSCVSQRAMMTVPRGSLEGSGVPMKLSGFQSMMSCWERWHPINAVQLVRIAGAIDCSRIAGAVWRTLIKLEDATRGQWRMGFGSFPPRSEAVSIDTSSPMPSTGGVEQFVSHQMNTPFHDSDLPVRFGCFTTEASVNGLDTSPDNGTTVVWLCYRHVIADARSVALLMQHLLEELTASETSPVELRLTAAGDLNALRNSLRSAGGLFTSCLSSLRALVQLQYCRRRKPRDIADFRMEFQIHGESLPVAALRQRALEHGITVGEFFTASVLEWLRDLPTIESAQDSRSSRCVSVLADVTSRVGGAARLMFGQYICPLTVKDHSHSGEDSLLADTVRRQMRGKENLDQSISSLTGLKWNSWLLPLYPGRTGLRLQEFLFPLGAAISNVNLNSMLPPDCTTTSATAYWRSTCATQFCPVIVCLTTFNNTCTLTSTHFPSFYSESEIRQLGQTLLARLFGESRLQSCESADCRHSLSFDHEFSEKNLSCVN